MKYICSLKGLCVLIKSTFFEIEINDTNCVFSENKFDSTYLTITIKAIIDYYESVSPAFEVPINCTSRKLILDES